MAKSNSSKTGAAQIQPRTTPDQDERDLLIEICPDRWVLYEGTRAQLEAEGVIPEGTEWPRANDVLRWASGKFEFWLFRKLKRKVGVGGDWWSLRCQPTNRVYDYAAIQIKRKTAELAEAMWRFSPAGQREWDDNYDRYLKAAYDERFQAFKALIPGLVPPKRGRKPAQHQAV